jgi:hypothetical protein
LAYCDADGPQCSPGCESIPLPSRFNTRILMSACRPRSDTCNKEFKCMRRSVVPLGGTCASYTECPAGVDCRGNICGGPTAQCQQDSDCVIGRECPVFARRSWNPRHSRAHHRYTVANRITYSNSNVLGGLLPSPTSQGGRGKMCQRRRLSRRRSMYQRDLWG